MNKVELDNHIYLTPKEKWKQFLELKWLHQEDKGSAAPIQSLKEYISKN